MGLEFNKTISAGNEISINLNTSGFASQFPKQSIGLNNPFNKARFPKFSNLFKLGKTNSNSILLEVSIMLMMATLIIVFGGAYAIGKLILMLFHKH